MPAMLIRSYLVSSFLFFSITFNSICQDSIAYLNKLTSYGVSDIPYDRLLDREFTHILTGLNSNFGTYASLGTKDEIANFSGHISLNENSNLTLNAKGGITEGIIPLLNGEDVSPNISIGLQFNFGIYKNKNTIIADATQMRSFQNMVDSLRIATENERFKLTLLKDKLILNFNQNELKGKQNKETLKKAAEYRKSLQDIDNPRKPILMDSINNIILKLEIEYKEIEQEKKATVKKMELLTKDEIRRQRQYIEDSKVRKYEKEVEKLNLLGYKLKWFSIKSNLNNRKFNLFDKNADQDSLISPKAFSTIELGLNYNIYNLSEKKLCTYYLSVGVSYSLTDNFDDLTKVNYSKESIIASSPSNIKIDESKTVYVGEYDSDIGEWSLSGDLYWFPSKTNLFAFHTYPRIRTDLSSKAKFDLLFGFLLGFKNSEKDKNIINAEIFYDMLDITKKSENKDDKIVDRSSLGLRLSFPITFKSNM